MFDSLLKGTKDATAKAVGDQVKAVATEVVSELGGNPQKSEQGPTDAGDTKDFLRRVYAPGDQTDKKPTIDMNAIRQAQQQEEENTPFNMEVVRAKIAGKEPPVATKQRDVARLHQEYVTNTFETPQQPQPPEPPEQPEPIKSSHEHTSSVTL